MSLQGMKLRTGEMVASVTVTATMLSLEGLLAADPIAFYECVEMARRPSHLPLVSPDVVIENHGLLQDGRMHDEVRKVILAATEGEGTELRLVSPAQQMEEKGLPLDGTTDLEYALLHLAIEIENDEGPLRERYERLREMARIAIEAAGMTAELP
jgi:hypothetical protein